MKPILEQKFGYFNSDTELHLNPFDKYHCQIQVTTVGKIQKNTMSCILQ